MGVRLDDATRRATTFFERPSSPRARTRGLSARDDDDAPYAWRC
jgi:hypothetical protein